MIINQIAFKTPKHWNELTFASPQGRPERVHLLHGVGLQAEAVPGAVSGTEFLHRQHLRKCQTATNGGGGTHSARPQGRQQPHADHGRRTDQGGTVEEFSRWNHLD